MKNYDHLNNLAHYRVLDQLPDGYEDKLHDYLLEHCDEFFNDPVNKADSELDVDTFPAKSTDRNHLVKYGELLLVDLDDPERGEDLGYRYEMGHSYFICSVMHSHNLRKVFRVISIRTELSGKHWRNGYFLLPKLP